MLDLSILTQRITREQLTKRFGTFPQTKDIFMDEDMINALKDPRRRLVAKRCTAVFRPPIYIMGALTLKGPFEKDSLVPQRVLERTKRLVAWGAGDTTLHCVVLTLPQSGIRFLAFRTVGTVPDECQDTIFYRWSKSPMKGFVAVPPSSSKDPSKLHILNRRLNLLKHEALTEDQWFHVFQHLLMRFVVQCGDVGFRNIFVDTRTGNVWGMDLDENDRRKEDDWTSVWHACIQKNSFRSEVKPVVQEAMEKLKSKLTTWFKERWAQANKSHLLPSIETTRRWKLMMRLMEQDKWLIRE